MKMLNLGKIWIVFIMLCSLLGAKEVVEAKLSNDSVPKGSIVKLELIAHGSNVEFPDIQKIGDAPVLSKHQSMKIYASTINGQSVTDNQKVLTIEFEAKGDMDIKPFDIKVDGKEYQTNPLHLHTTKAIPLDKKPFYLKMDSPKKSVMVDEPFVVSVYFVVRDDVILATQPRYNPPKFDGFFVSEPKQSNYKKGRYNITKIDYILTPKAEGNYTITPASAKVAISSQRQDPFFGFGMDAKWYALNAKPLSIHVSPKPDDVALIGEFKVIAKIDKEHTKANKPVNLSIKIFGSGSLEDVELPSYDIDGVSVYSDDATIKSEVKNGKIYSSYIKTYAFISDSDFDIPEVTLKAYNPATQQEYNLTIPSYHISVDGSNLAMVSTNTKSQTPLVHTNLKTDPITTNDSHNDMKPSISIAPWWSLVIAFIAGMLATFGLKKLDITIKKPKFSISNDEALKILYPHIGSDESVEKMVRDLYAKANGDKSVKIDKEKLKDMIKKYKHEIR